MSVATGLHAFERSPRDAITRLRYALFYDWFGVHGLTLYRFGCTALFVASLALWSTLGNVLAEGRGIHDAPRSFVEYFQTLFAQWSTSVFPTMIAATFADSLPLKGARRLLALTGALIGGALVDVAYRAYVEPCGAQCASLPLWEQLFDLADDICNRVGFTATVAAAYFYRRNDQAVAAALHASELARVDAERERLQSMLHAMQARVDPSFLQQTLRSVAGLYETDRKAAGQLLDSVTHYLRTALLRTGGPNTLEHEARLLRAYLGILAAASRGSLAVTFDVEPILANASIPPMMLLPLVTLTTMPPSAMTGALLFSGRNVDRRVRLAITVNGAISRLLANASAVFDVRERLSALYGKRASFVVDRHGDTMLLVILELPHERADSDHR